MSASPQNNGNVGVAVRDLHRSFNGNEVLKGISFDVKPGETFVIMGPSGSGKSVLLKHIIGLEDPDSGEILIADQSVHGSEVLSNYRVAMVFQSGALLKSLSVGENVGLYLAEHRLKTPEEISRIVAEKLEAVGLKGLEDRSPSELSGGMQKRVAIARALVIDPQLVLFDEPTSELDPLMSVNIGEQIMQMRDRLHPTIIVVTHDRDLAFAIADRIAMINEGQIHFIGTPDEVKHTRDPMIQKFIHAELTNP
jgi:phospholipid/cholesterol/gamma-HCH transport system ATP-binding protein